MITIKQATEVLQNTSTNPPPMTTDLEIESIRLGIEALKRILECRHADHTIKEDYLPGEKKE